MTSASFCPSCGSPRTGGAYCSNCGKPFDLTAPAPQAPAAQVPIARQLPVPAVALVIGGVMVAAGAFLPWITVTAAFVGTIERNGLDGGGDGLIAIGVGAAIAFLGVQAL